MVILIANLSEITYKTHRRAKLDTLLKIANKKYSLYLNMELKVEIGFDELLHAIQQLPENQRAILKEELDKKHQPEAEMSDFQKFLINGPIMSKEENENFKDIRKRINKWRAK
jgi:hypothetical protein